MMEHKSYACHSLHTDMVYSLKLTHRIKVLVFYTGLNIAADRVRHQDPNEEQQKRNKRLRPRETVLTKKMYICSALR